MLNNEDKQEYIICAAIWYKDKKKHVHQPNNIDSGFVICGHRHHNCFMTFYILHDPSRIRRINKIQGFLTSKNNFVERDKAAIIAFDAGQTVKLCKILFSEDLY